MIYRVRGRSNHGSSDSSTPIVTHDGNMFDFERFYHAKKVPNERVKMGENKNNEIVHEFGSSSSNWFAILQVVNVASVRLTIFLLRLLGLTE